MRTVAKARRFRFELAHRRFGATAVARDDYDTGAHSREREDSDFADARCRAGRDNGLVLHRTVLRSMALADIPAWRQLDV